LRASQNIFKVLFKMRVAQHYPSLVNSREIGDRTCPYLSPRSHQGCIVTSNTYIFLCREEKGLDIGEGTRLRTEPERQLHEDVPPNNASSSVGPHQKGRKSNYRKSSKRGRDLAGAFVRRSQKRFRFPGDAAGTTARALDDRRNISADAEFSFVIGVVSIGPTHCLVPCVSAIGFFINRGMRRVNDRSAGADAGGGRVVSTRQATVHFRHSGFSHHGIVRDLSVKH
jgi:hypothetical protein